MSEINNNTQSNAAEQNPDLGAANPSYENPQGSASYTYTQSNQQYYANQNNGQQYYSAPNGQQAPNYTQPFSYAPQNGGYEQKSKIAAGLLGIFLGSLGVHNFYLGYNGKALAQLLITLLTCGVGAVVTSIWGLIEGIMLLTSTNSVDANGVPLKD